MLKLVRDAVVTVTCCYAAIFSPFLVLMFLSGCSVAPEATLPFENKVEFVRIFYHTHNFFTVMSLEEKQELIIHHVQGKVFADVPEGKPMFYVDHFDPQHPNRSNPDWHTYEIHIHTPKEIGGGEYKSGKNSTGRSLPIEQP